MNMVTCKIVGTGQEGELGHLEADLSPCYLDIVEIIKKEPGDCNHQEIFAAR
ncbi:MAG: hypothetical protein MZV70_30355 [Desulfobacterales bacterium]|nr:hypothetical protein [Desulfobacterales bacterium]